MTVITQLTGSLKRPPTPSIPTWIPPIDTGQPSASELDDLGSLPKANVTARHSTIPIVYGRDRLFGQAITVTVDEEQGNLYVAHSFGEGPINGYENIYVDGEDKFLTGAAYIGLKNRGFESGTGDEWTLNGATISAAQAYRGTYSARIVCGAGGPNVISALYAAPPEGVKMRISGWFMRDAASLPDASVSVALRWYDASGTPVGSRDEGDVGEQVDALAATVGWQQSSGLVTVPAGATQYSFDFGESTGTTGHWFADDANTDVLSDDNPTLSADAIEFVLYTGDTSQDFDSLLHAQLDGFVDTNSGLAYIVMRAPKGSTQGFPRVEAVVQGKKIFDPRAYNMLYDNAGDPLFALAANTDTATAQWFSVVNESASLASDGWTVETSDPSPAGATYAELIDNNDDNNSMFSKEVPCDLTRDYTITVYVKQPSGDRKSYLGMAFYDANGDLITSSSSPVSDATWSSIGTYHYHSIVNQVIPSSWTQYQFDFGPSAGTDGEAPSNAVSMRIASLFLRDGAVGTNSTVRVSDYRIFEGLKEAEQSETDNTTHTYTQNPAICFRDVMRNHTSWDLFDYGVADLANYNDELISGVKRREIGLTMGKANTVDAWIKGFRTYMGAFLGWEAGKLRVIPNRADVQVQGAVFGDGVDGEVDMGNVPELDFGAAQDFTVECSFKTSDATGTKVLVGKKDSAGSNTSAGYSLKLSDLSVSVSISDGVNGAFDEITGSFDDGEWHHAAFTVDQTANELEVYVDGVASGSPTDITTIGSLTTTEVFRLLADEAGNFLDGGVDEVRVWNDIRTPAELANNRLQEIANPKLDSSLVGYWKLNDGIGATVALDESRSGNDGTLLGGAEFMFGSAQVIPTGVAMHITVDDIVKDSLRVKRRSLRNVPNSVAIDYEDASGLKWHTERVQKDSPRVTSEEEARRLSRISLPGIHNASQAQREATERLNWYLTDLECKVSLFDEGWQLQHGSVVAITHPIGLDAKLMRVTQTAAHSGRWTVDMSEYDPAVYSDEVVSDPTTPDTNLGNPLNPPTVSNLTLAEELFRYKNGLTGSRVRINFSASKYPFLSQYLIEGYVEGTKVWQLQTQANSVVTPGVEELVSDVAVDYEVKVYVQSPFATGVAATQEVAILGKLAAPGDVPTLNATKIAADTVRLSWGEAVDIDIWRYEVRIGDPITNNTWELATTLELVDGLTHNAEQLPTGNHRFFVKARDSVGNESANSPSTDITLGTPPAVTSINGFEVASEVRLNWPAVTTGFVERYRVAYDTVTPSNEVTLDTVDTLRFSTKDVPEGTWKFLVYARDRNGVEALTAPSVTIEVTSDADAFLADTYNFVTPSLTNMVEYVLRLDDRQLYVTNMGGVLSSSPSDFTDFSGVALANYHGTGASEWLSETKDFGLSLTGSWNLTHDVTALAGNVTVELELSTDNVTYTVFGGAAKGAFRYARVRISTTGLATAFVKTPLMNLRINVVPLEESGESTSSGVDGTPDTIQLSREYTAVKEIVTQVKNKIDGLYSVVDNIILGPNTAVKGDGTNYLSGGDIAAFDFGATQDFSFELKCKNVDGTGIKRLIGKTGAGGWRADINEGTGQVACLISDGTTTINFNSATGLIPVDGLYHTISVTVDRTADQARIYVDATLDANSPVDISTVTGALDAGATAFAVHATGSGSFQYNGPIDEVRVWDTVRTPTEITDNLNNEAPIISSLIGYWKMDGAVSTTVTTVQDATANNNDLTSTGGGSMTYVDPGSAGNTIQKINSFDVYVFDTFGQQLAESYQWKWKAV